MKSDNEYFYIKYKGDGIEGTVILRQKRIPEFERNPDGLNLAGAYEVLFKLFNPSVIIESWQWISEKRKEEFELFMLTNWKAVGFEVPKRKLSLVPNPIED